MGISVQSSGMRQMLLSVMIVEDQPLAAEFLRSVVDWEKAGFRIVAEAGNGEEALDLLERYRPDVVFADVEMPVMDGLEFARKAVKIQRWSRFVIISSHQQFDYVKQAISLGAVDYILKHELKGSTLIPFLAGIRRDCFSALEYLSLEWKNAYRALQETGAPPAAGYSPFLTERIGAGDLWVYASAGAVKGQDKLQSPFFPDTPGRYRRMMEAALHASGTIAFYSLDDRNRLHEHNMDIEHIGHTLQKDLKQQGSEGKFLYVYGLFSGSRHEGQSIFEIIRKVEACRSRYPASLVVDAGQLDILFKELSQNPERKEGCAYLTFLAQDFIRENFMKPVGTSEVASAVGVSTAYLCQKFREETGDTVLHALTKLRIEQAQLLLTGSCSDINEIADACGFTSPRYFSQVFRKVTGETPSAFREKRAARR